MEQELKPLWQQEEEKPFNPNGNFFERTWHAVNKSLQVPILRYFEEILDEPSVIGKAIRGSVYALPTMVDSILQLSSIPMAWIVGFLYSFDAGFLKSKTIQDVTNNIQLAMDHEGGRRVGGVGFILGLPTFIEILQATSEGLGLMGQALGSAPTINRVLSSIQQIPQIIQSQFPPNFP